jgi:MerR family transcriptional regulator, copper efflux regulator
MNIGQAAEGSGVTAKMIRYYESIGLLPAAGRRESGYRDYSETDLHRLRFVRRARDLGFSTERIKQLLALWGDNRKSDARVREVAEGHVAELEAQARDLQEMISVLKHLIKACAKGDRPHCPILTDLKTGPKAGKETQPVTLRGRSRKPH